MREVQQPACRLGVGLRQLQERQRRGPGRTRREAGRFQDAADFRKSWEPYEQAGVNQFSPEQVQWGLEFMQALENPQAIQQWYEQYAQQNGLQAEQGQQPAPDEFAYDQPSQEQLEQ